MKSPPGFYTEQELKKSVSQARIDYIMRGIASQEEEELHPTLQKLFKIEKKEVSA